MTASFKERLVDILISGKLIEKAQLEKALAIQKKSGASLSKILVDEGFISQKALMVALSHQLSIPPIDLTKFKTDSQLVKLIPEKIARQYNLIPISKIGTALTVAMTDPLNIFAIDDLKMLTSYKIEPVLATEDDIKDAIQNAYGSHAQEQEINKILQNGEIEDVEVMAEEEEDLDVGEVSEASLKAPIVKVVSLMINEALKRRASDIHIEPCEKYLRVRYRIDGTLHEALTLPKKNQNAIIARIKIMSRLDITETRIPQDGRFTVSFQGREIDFRVSVLPITYGGKVVLRALDKTSLSIGLDKLGFLPAPLKTFRAALEKPYGMILVTGPTGSGKSTTLYSIINQINSVERNIVTLEDPVEYELEGITQIHARPEIGLTFSSGLKSILRQTPDVIMVGEIRDFETADIAIKASLTGQIFLSTLHTNDAAGAITRLIDMGVEPFLVGSSLILTSAQRLMRKVCPHCKEAVDIPNNVLERIDLKHEDIKKRGIRHFYKGAGCPKCNGTGYFGRIAILEAMIIDDPIRDMIMRKASSDEIKAYAVKEQGMMTLRDNAMENFVTGVSTLEEALRVTSEDEA